MAFLLVSLTLFVATFYYITTDLSYTPAEADMQSTLRQADSFSQFNREFGHGGLVSRFLFYQAHTGLNMGIMGRKAAACAITTITLLYVLFLARGHYAFHGYALFIPMALFTLNGPFVAFGSWGWFTYALGVALSALLIHITLILHDLARLTLVRRLMIAAAMAAMAFLSVRNILPITLALFVFWLYHAASPPRSPKKIVRLTGNALMMGLPAVAVALYILVYWAHVEFSQPRDVLWRLYFPLSEHPYTIPGAVRFWFSRSAALLRVLWPVTAHNPGSIHLFRVTDHSQQPTALMYFWALLFLVGLASSLARHRSKEFFLGSLVLLTFAAVSCMSLLGLYAYGHVRYVLFALVPILFCSALGLRDCCTLAGRLSSVGLNGPRGRHIAMTLKTLGFVIAAVFVLHLQWTALCRTAQHRHQYNDTWLNVMAQIDREPKEALVWDFYTQLLLKAARPSLEGGDRFYFGRAFARQYEEHGENLSHWRDFLDKHDRITVLTYHDFFKGPPEFRQPVVDAFEVTRLPGMSYWNLYRFERRSKGENK